MSADIKHHRRTRRLMWAMLITASAGSMAGNIAAAGEHRNSLTAAGAVAASAIPPLALLALTHLAGMWSRIRSRGIVYWCFLAAVAAIAAAAFRLSFAALRSLAVNYGYSHTDAALFPLILDGLVAVCTLGLVVLARIEADHDAVPGADEARDAHHDPAGAHRESPGAHRDATHESVGSVRESPGAVNGEDRESGGTHDRPTLTGGESATIRAIEHRGVAALSESRLELRDTALNSGDARIASGESWWRTAAVHRDAESAPRRAAHRDSDAHRRIAHHLVDAGRTTLDPDAVHQVLDRTAAGESGRAVAAQLGVSASAVQRVLKAARDAHDARTGT